MLRAVGEDLVAVLRDQDQVLDAQTREPQYVDAGLDRDDHPGLQHVVGALREAGLLMYLETRPVPQAVRERLRETLLRQVVAGDGVDSPPRPAGADRRDPTLLRLQHGVVQPFL